MNAKALKFFLILLTVLSFVWVVVVGVILYTAGVSSSNAQDPSHEIYGSTKAKIVRLDSNADTLVQGTLYQAVYGIVNVGEDSLHILEVNPDCLCTSFRISAYDCPPNDTIVLALSVDTVDKLYENEIKTVIELNTDERFYLLKSRLYVQLVTNISTASFETANSIFVPDLRIGKEAVIPMRIVNTTDDQVIVNVSTSCNCISVNQSRIILFPNASADYTVVVFPDSVGTYSEYLILKSDKGDIRRIDVKGQVL